MASFADVQYNIYADKVDVWGPKRQKICWRNIGTVIYNIIQCSDKNKQESHYELILIASWSYLKWLLFCRVRAYQKKSR